MTSPRLTVITVAYNAAAHIEQTILSVAEQAEQNIEYLVIDGGSRDGTVDILRRLSAHIGRWVSEPDSGIYDAMNKGIALARGDWILFLNADDYFSGPDAVRKLLDSADDSVSIVAGGTLIKYADAERIFRPHPRLGLKLQLPFMHASTIVRRSALDACGGFDERYRIAADCDLFLRLIGSGHKFRCIPDVVSVMRDGGVSSRGYVRARLEYMQAYRRVMRDPLGAFAGFAASMLMFLRSKLR